MSDTVSSKLDRCSAQQLKQLLTLASNQADVASDWVVDVGDSERLEILLTEICSGTEYSGAALLEELCSPITEVSILAAIKDFAKGRAVAAKDNRHKAAAMMLSHLSSASLLAYHNRSISPKRANERLLLYEELAAQLSDEKLAGVFDQAVSRLKHFLALQADSGVKPVSHKDQQK